MNAYMNHLKTKYFENLTSEAFDNNRAQVNEDNRSGIVIILLFTFLIIAVNLIVQLAMGLSALAQFIELGIYALLALVVYWRALKRPEANQTLWIYVTEFPLILISLIAGTVFEPHGQTTFTFMFILCVFPPLILDKPKHIATVVLVAAAAFALLDYPFKDSAVFSRDMLHLFNVCLITIGASTYYISTRMQNIRYASHFAEKSVRDPLTGLYNRAGAERNIDASESGALIFIDLDNFKKINDTFGHSEGDRVLKQTAQALRKNFRNEDVVIRHGGDEFAIYMKGPWTADNVDRRLRQMLDNLKEITVSAEGKGEVSVLASAGCAVAPHGCESLDKLIRLADEQMYQVKQSGKSGYRIVEVA